MKTKIISMILLVAMVFSVAAMGMIPSFAEGEDKYPRHEPSHWADEEGLNDQDYTFAFVGDIQKIMEIDYLRSTDNDPSNDTNYVDTLFTWLAENAEAKKIKHVFTLGDLTEYSATDDADLAYATGTQYGDAEWQILKRSITKLDGVVPYSVIRGNHDDYQIDDFFNYEAYTENFDGFYREESGTYKDSITNSYRLVNLGGYKFIFITLDFNPTRAVVTWLDEILTTYSDHKAIITTHTYIDMENNLATVRNLQGVLVAGKYNGAAPDWIWKNCLKNHENVLMTVCGHLDGRDTHFVMTEGDNGNKIANLMVNPQLYDKDTQPTGMLFFMHFYNGGTTVKTEYYSTFLDLYRADSHYEWEIDYGDALRITEATTAEATVAESTDAQTTAETTSEASKNNCKSALSLASIALVPAVATFSAVSLKKRKKQD